nr:zinc ribbon domain-containing protein [uncultured Agathobaculum sp.]
MFCRECGKLLLEGIRFCPDCGTSVAVDSATGSSTKDNTSPLCTLTIDRASQVYLINPPVKVIIDNSIRFSIANGQTQSVQLTAGKHIIQFKCSLRSTRVDINISKDTLIELIWDHISGKLTTKIT